VVDFFYNVNIKLQKRYFFIITSVLILALFAASSSLIPVENSSKTGVEKIVEESNSEQNSDIKYISSSVLSALAYQLQLEIHAYAKIYYTYTYSKSIYKPPRLT